MDRERQTVELLQLLGDDVAESVLAHMAPEQAQRLRDASARRDTGPSDSRARRNLLREFEQFLRLAKAGRVSQPDDDDDDDTTAARSKSDTLSVFDPAQLSGDPLQDLQQLSQYQVAQAVETEQPRTTAILLNHLGPKLAAEVLSLLADDYRHQVVRELSREQHAPQVLVERVARATFNRAMTLPAEPPDRRDHSDRLAEVLRAVPKHLRSQMMSAIDDEDEDLGKRLLKKLYRFEDILTLESRQIQRVLGEVDGGTLTTSLFGASDEIVEMILSNLSKRARQSIEEELEFQTSVPQAVLNAARDAVCEAIAKVEQEVE